MIILHIVTLCLLITLIMQIFDLVFGSMDGFGASPSAIWLALANLAWQCVYWFLLIGG